MLLEGASSQLPPALTPSRIGPCGGWRAHPPPTPLLQVALIEAILLRNQDGCLAAIQAALEAGADVNVKDSRQGLSPLH